jgi:hypothetical protein
MYLMVMIPNAPRLGDMPKSEPVPEGVYHIRCDKAGFKKSSKGEGMVEVQFTIFGPGEQEQYHGRKLFENLMMEGAGMFKTRDLLEAAGFDEDYTLEDTDALINLEVAAVVQVQPAREADGKKYEARNQIKRFLPIS